MTRNLTDKILYFASRFVKFDHDIGEISSQSSYSGRRTGHTFLACHQGDAASGRLAGYPVRRGGSCCDILMIAGRNKPALEDHFDRAPAVERTLELKGDEARLD